MFISTILIIILFFNIWFISNRLQSDARIVAYIELVHEGIYKEHWIGWESSLREYRKCHTESKKEEALKKLSNDIDKKAIHKGFNFYPSIWLFHIVIVITIFIITAFNWWNQKNKLNSVIMIIFTIITLYFMIYSVIYLRPDKMKPSIERERSKWLFVFQNNIIK